MLTSYHVELKSHTNHDQMLNISKCPQKRARKDTISTAQNCRMLTQDGCVLKSTSCLLLFARADSGKGISWRLGHNFCGYGDQLGSIPYCLELLRNGEFSIIVTLRDQDIHLR